MTEISESTVLEGLHAIVHDLFDDESIVLTASTVAADVPGWDSFMHVNIVVSVEGRFGVKFSTTDIESLKSVGDIVRVVMAKRA